MTEIEIKSEIFIQFTLNLEINTFFICGTFCLQDKTSLTSKRVISIGLYCSRKIEMSEIEFKSEIFIQFTLNLEINTFLYAEHFVYKTKPVSLLKE